MPKLLSVSRAEKEIDFLVKIWNWNILNWNPCKLCQATCVASFPYGLGARFKIYGALFKLRLKNL